MTQHDTYDDALARHYKAFRPPLHQLILQRVLSSSDKFKTGLDIGCGTGYSAIALAQYCTQVYAIDPSPAMLKQATTENKNIVYQTGSAECIPYDGACFDIITYAGSLFYADKQQAATELKRIAKRNAQVLIYDFAVVFEPFIKSHQLVLDNQGNDYDHYCNLAGTEGFSSDPATTERISFPVSAKQLMHLLLSEAALLQAYEKRYKNDSLEERLLQDLEQSKTHYEVQADIFYSQYTL